MKCILRPDQKAGDRHLQAVITTGCRRGQNSQVRVQGAQTGSCTYVLQNSAPAWRRVSKQTVLLLKLTVQLLQSLLKGGICQ